MKIERRFYFSQVSALIVIFLASFAWIGMAKVVIASLETPAHPSVSLRIAVLLIGAPLFCALAVRLWRSFLIYPRILSREEAHGYPYSRPWRQSVISGLLTRRFSG
jgi:hypothetical protein